MDQSLKDVAVALLMRASGACCLVAFPLGMEPSVRWLSAAQAQSSPQVVKCLRKGFKSWSAELGAA